MLAIATLLVWLVAGVAGLYMFGTWLRHGGPRQQRGRADGLPPAVILAHLGFGALGLLVWVSYLVTGLDAVAWAAVVLLMPGIGLGICTVTLWAPYPTPPGSGPPAIAGDAGDTGPGGAGPAGGMLAAPAPDAVSGRLTDQALASALASEALTSKLIGDALAGLPPRQGPPPRRSRRHLAPLVPAGHGIAAVTTFVLAVLTAIGAR